MADAAALPFGVAELLALARGAGRVLDAGCGSGRLTVALARAGSRVTGIDTNPSQLDTARRRAEDAGIELELREADFNGPLPFPDGHFDAVVSRLSLMAADDAAVTLRGLYRVLAPGGTLATLLWASPDENPWFGLPRQAVGNVLGAERAAFARAFGKLGDPETAAAVHREAGLAEVTARLLREQRTAPDAAAYWRELSEENGHFRRIAASLDDEKRAEIEAELVTLLAPYLKGDHLSLPRTLVLVSGRH